MRELLKTKEQLIRQLQEVELQIATDTSNGRKLQELVGKCFRGGNYYYKVLGTEDSNDKVLCLRYHTMFSDVSHMIFKDLVYLTPILHIDDSFMPLCYECNKMQIHLIEISEQEFFNIENLKEGISRLKEELQAKIKKLIHNYGIH